MDLRVRKTECKNGHPFNADNTRVDRRGKRSCIECGRIRSRVYQRKKRDPHYHRKPKIEDPVEYARQTLDRFESCFVRDERTGCWLWKKNTSNGYGQTSLFGRSMTAHRAFYELFVGPVPDGLQLDHLCRVRRCVNPSHLEPVTAKENVHRGTSFAAENAMKTHCRRGHELSLDNAFPSDAKNGRRTCRKCYSINRAERLARSRGPKGDATASGPSTEPQEVQP